MSAVSISSLISVSSDSVAKSVAVAQSKKKRVAASSTNVVARPLEIDVLLLNVFQNCRPGELATLKLVSKKWCHFISSKNVWFLQVNFHDAFASGQSDVAGQQYKLLRPFKPIKANQFDNAGGSYFVNYRTFKLYPILHPLLPDSTFKCMKIVVTDIQERREKLRENGYVLARERTKNVKQYNELDARKWAAKSDIDFDDTTLAAFVAFALTTIYLGTNQVLTGIKWSVADVTILGSVASLLCTKFFSFFSGTPPRSFSGSSFGFDYAQRDLCIHVIKQQKTIDILKRHTTEMFKTEKVFKQILAGNLFDPMVIGAVP